MLAFPGRNATVQSGFAGQVWPETRFSAKPSGWFYQFAVRKTVARRTQNSDACADELTCLPQLGQSDTPGGTSKPQSRQLAGKARSPAMVVEPQFSQWNASLAWVRATMKVRFLPGVRKKSPIHDPGSCRKSRNAYSTRAVPFSIDLPQNGHPRFVTRSSACFLAPSCCWEIVEVVMEFGFMGNQRVGASVCRAPAGSRREFGFDPYPSANFDGHWANPGTRMAATAQLTRPGSNS